MGKAIDREVTDRAFTQEQRELLWRYWPLARSQAKRYARKLSPRGMKYQLEFYMSDWAIDYLFDRVRTYQPDLYPNFATYYLAMLPHYLYRQTGYYLNEFHLSKNAHFDRMESSPHNAVEAFECQECLARLYNTANISTTEREYLRKWAEADSYHSMAAELNVSPQAVHTKVKRILNQIRQAIGEQ